MSGVLSNSGVIRNKHLQQNLSLYEAYDGTSKGLSYYAFNTKPLKRINNGSLYDYTHNELTNYSKNIGHLYFKHRPDFQPYINIDPINPQNFWGGEYHDYYDYVNAVYTQISPPIQFIEGLLSTQFLDEAIRVTSPAIVHNPEPTLSMAGVVKTNVNNFSGTDTRTGLLGNQMYAHALYHGANFNSMRKGTTTFSENHITPSAYIRFGNSNYTINSLSSIVSALRADGKIIEDYNEGIQIYDDISNLGGDINPTNLFENLYRGSDYQYNKFGKEISFDINNDTFINYTSEKISPSYQSGKLNDVTQHLVYSDNNTTLDISDLSNPKFVETIPEYETEFDEYDYILDRNSDLSKNSLLFKTNNLFREHKINNFGFGGFYDSKHENTTTDSASVSDERITDARSRGRNLLKKKWGGNKNGYPNPFCRTWTYHHQYDTLDKLIRPLSDDEGNLLDIEKTQALNARYRTFVSGSTIERGDIYLAHNTVLNNNGMVNIAPSNSKNGHVDIKKCMFSLENLAWKDVLDKENYLSKEQRGPNGGRIMWFPPYDLNFSENTNVNWEQSTFIGRGEKMYTYSNTDRNGTLSFTLLIDHPSTIHNVYTDGGSVRSDITDEHILRFFAGCGPLEAPESDKIPPKETPIIPPEENEPQEKTAEIYVYFPNNYSGHYTSIVNSVKDDKSTPPDEDFVDYMVYGYNATIDGTGDVNKKRGYEMLSDNKGLTIKDTKEGTFYCCNVKPTSYKKCENNGTKLFYYRTDFDLKQKNLQPSSYMDSSSYQLNSKNAAGGFTFSHFVYVYKKKTNDGFEDFKTYMKNIIGEEKIEDFVKKCAELEDILSKTEQITQINIIGSATNQDSPNSNMLANRRGGTLKHLITQISPNIKNINITKRTEGEGKEINSPEIKSKRYSCIEIKYKVAKSELLADNNHKEDKKETDSSKMTVTANTEYIRYENEAQYFSKLQKTDSFLYQKLTTKFKYFTPAFHSVSPEGFNARLTFLQQCTRQGHTIEPKISSTDSDKPTEIAGNLSFGRMPVCILRIGDFIYSRVIITSMSINYGDNQWDLNPEGIGVQPMMAKVNLGITILGGQSLEGPISRLQNAITFNHYANAGVYDNRADRAKPAGEPNNWSTDNYYTWEPEFNDGSDKS